MDIYKLKPGHNGYKRIDCEQFEADTGKKRPWYQSEKVRTHGNADGQIKERHYAVCPACDNPIQIIGLYNLPKNVKRPYGKHIAKTIENLADLHPDARDACPYFKPRPYHRSDRKPIRDEQSRKIIQLLIDQFDRVVYLLSKETGIRFSRNFLKTMLKSYRYADGFQYMGATLLNVPWIFAYMTSSISLYGQHVRDNTALSEAIERMIPAATIDADGRVVADTTPDGKQQYFQISICYIHHKATRKKPDGGLRETMKMMVSTNAEHGDATDFVNIHEQLIEFDHDYFQHLIALPADHEYRRPELVELAREVLGDLCDV